MQAVWSKRWIGSSSTQLERTADLSPPEPRASPWATVPRRAETGGQGCPSTAPTETEDRFETLVPEAGGPVALPPVIGGGFLGVCERAD